MDLTVAVCTRDRPSSLSLCVDAILRSKMEAGPVKAEVLVVDDGDMSFLEAELDGRCRKAGVGFRRLAKQASDRGLYRSRRAAVAATAAPLVLFVDDDADLSESYLSTFLGWFADPDVVGVGGVDVRSLPLGLGTLGSVLGRVFRLTGDAPGSLSLAGMNYSQAAWRLQQGPFASEYLHGCNMGFRTSCLREMPEVNWLVGHSPTEDLVVSCWAAKLGRLVVDPALAVVHREEPGNRGDAPARICAKLVCQYRFATQFRGVALGVFLWAAFGQFAKDVVRRPLRDVVVGYGRALRNVLRERLAFA